MFFFLSLYTVPPLGKDLSRCLPISSVLCLCHLLPIAVEYDHHASAFLAYLGVVFHRHDPTKQSQPWHTILNAYKSDMTHPFHFKFGRLNAHVSDVFEHSQLFRIPSLLFNKLLALYRSLTNPELEVLRFSQQPRLGTVD